MLWQLIEVFGASHSARLRKALKSINRLTYINPTVWEWQEFKKFKKQMKSCCQNDKIKTVKKKSTVIYVYIKHISFEISVNESFFYINQSD